MSARRCLKPGLHAPHQHQRGGVTYECDGRHGQVAPGSAVRTAPSAVRTADGPLSPESTRLIAELADAMHAVVERKSPELALGPHPTQKG